MNIKFIKGELMDNLKKNLGKRIKELRKSQKFTQEKLSEIINLDTPNLSNIERGKHFLSADTLTKIAKALNVPVFELFNYEHFCAEDELSKKISDELTTLSTKELEFIYKSIKNLQEMRK